jgi:hypothetical protein
MLSKIMAFVIKSRLGKNHRNSLLTDQDLAIKISGDVVFPMTSFPLNEGRLWEK